MLNGNAMDPIPHIPPVAPPLTPPLTPIGDQRPGTGRFARRLASRRATLQQDGDGGEDEFQDLPPTPWRVDPTQPLLEALDRLRVINGARPAELEYAKAVRAMKAYQDPTTQIHRNGTAPAVPAVDGAADPEAPGDPTSAPSA